MNDWYDAEQHVEKAHEHFEAGRWSEAESELRAALALNPHQAEWHFNLGLTLDAAGRYDAAQQSFEEAHRLDPDNKDVALMIGLGMLREGDPRGSIQWFERAETIDAADPMSHVYRIDAYSQLGDHEQAELMFYLSQQGEKEHPSAFVAMADSLLARNEFERATWCLRRAAELDPTLAGIQARLAEIHAKTGRLERARHLYLRELRQNPGDIETLLDLGDLLMDMHRYSEASEKFRRALEIEPGNADAHACLADLADREGRIDDAIAYHRLVLRLAPNYEGTRRDLAHALLTRRGPDDLQQARVELLREFASFYCSSPRPAGKRGAGDRAGRTSSEPHDPETSKWRETREAASLPPSADEGKTDVVPDRGAPRKGEDLEELAALLIDAGLCAEAVRVARSASDLSPESAEAHHLLSVAWFGVGNLDAGRRAAMRAHRLARRRVETIYNLALASARAERWQRARAWVRRGREAAPEDAALRRLAFIVRWHSTVKTVRWLGMVFIRRRSRYGLAASRR